MDDIVAASAEPAGANGSALVVGAASDLPPAVVELLAALTPDASGRAAIVVGHYLDGLAQASRRPMAHALDAIADLATAGACDRLTLPWFRLTVRHTAAIRRLLVEATVLDPDGRPRRRFAPATVNRSLAALRGVLKAGWRLGYTDRESYERAAEVTPDRRRSLPKGRAAPVAELAALLDACGRDASLAGARDAALLMTLYGCGLRRAEAAALTLAAYDTRAATLRVDGKGGRERLAHLPPASRDWLERWLAARGRAPGALFCRVDRHGHGYPAAHLSGGAIYAVVDRRVAQAGLLDPLAPHDLRRSFISGLLEAGVDTLMAQALAGHASPATTARYDRRGEAARRAAAHRLPVPPAPTTP